MAWLTQIIQTFPHVVLTDVPLDTPNLFRTDRSQ